MKLNNNSLDELLIKRFPKTFKNKGRRFSPSNFSLNLIMGSLVIVGLKMNINKNENKFNKNFKKMNLKKKTIQFNNIKKKLNDQYRSYIKKNLWNSWLLQIYLIFKISQNYNFNLKKNYKRSNHNFNYLKAYSFNYNNICSDIINNKFALNNQRNENMKLEEFSKNKGEFKKINLKYKFN